MASNKLGALAGLVLLAQTGLADGNIFRVRQGAEEGGDGSSWSAAVANLQDAFDAAGNGDMIWVAEGTYFPDRGSRGTPGDRGATFFLRHGVEVYGGFAGTESSVDDRVGDPGKTLLSGDLAEDDAVRRFGDNSYHVVSAYGVDASCRLDGFTITAGHSNGVGTEDTGAGLTIWGPTSPVISNCIIRDNRSAVDAAGAILLDGCAPTFRDCLFVDNEAAQDAAAVYVAHSAWPTFEGCVFENNRCGRFGGAVAVTLAGRPTFRDCRFVDNHAGLFGGAVNVHDCNPRFELCQFDSNDAGLDGGAFWGTGATSFEGCGFLQNQAVRDGGALFTFGAVSSPSATNCILDDNVAGRHGGAWSSSASAILSGNRFSRNRAGGNGGAMDTSGTGQSTLIADCLLEANEAERFGGGIFQSGTGAQTLLRVHLRGNVANRGGGLYHGESALVLDTCVIEMNSASSKGGGVFLTNAVQGSSISATDFVQNSAGIVGGGLYVTNDSSPLVAGCTFVANSSDIHGGGVYNTCNEHAGGLNLARFEDCLFSMNTARNDGAAFFNSTSVRGGVSSPCLIRCEFESNVTGHHGGAVFNISFSGTGSPEFYSCNFTGNRAGRNGGAVYNKTPGHARSTAAPVFTSCVLNGNRSQEDGGAVYNLGASAEDGDCTVDLTNVTLTHNTAGRDGGGCYNARLGSSHARLSVRNSILWGNGDRGPEDSSQSIHRASGSLTVAHSTVQHWAQGGTANLSDDPRFEDPLGDDGQPGTADDRLTLQRRSPAVNSGNNGYLPPDRHDQDSDSDLEEPSPHDRARGRRVVGRGRENRVDMGAFERQANGRSDPPGWSVRNRQGRSGEETGASTPPGFLNASDVNESRGAGRFLGQRADS